MSCLLPLVLGLEEIHLDSRMDHLILHLLLQRSQIKLLTHLLDIMGDESVEHHGNGRTHHGHDNFPESGESAEIAVKRILKEYVETGIEIVRNLPTVVKKIQRKRYLQYLSELLALSLTNMKEESDFRSMVSMLLDDLRRYAIENHGLKFLTVNSWRWSHSGAVYSPEG